MSEPTLARLESEVEAARRKLAADLATLTSPSTVNHFRKTVTVEASAAKDRIVRSMQDGARSRVQDFVSTLKSKAAANPVAVAAIGAGIAWRLMRHPPITTALVGVGLYSLLNTDRREQPFLRRYGLEEKATALRDQVSDFGEAASDLAGHAAEKLQDWSTQARTAAGELASEVKQRTGLAADQLSEESTLRQSAQRMTAQVTHMGRQTASGIRATMSDDDSRDRMLLGVAGLAVAVAFGISLQRRRMGK